MTKRIVLLVALLSVLLSFTSTDAGRVDPNPPGKPGFFDRDSGARNTIVNEVIDLLDGEVLLGPDDAGVTWESNTFDTSRYTHIGLRASAEIDTGEIRCSVAWQFSPEDEFLVSLPSVRIGEYTRDVVVPPIYGEDPGEPAQRVRRLYPFGVPTIFPDFTEVYGLRGRVYCQASAFTVLGDDRSLDPEQPVLVTLSDVKVLLRRH